MSADAARAAYEARWTGMTLGPRGAAPAWDDLEPEGRAVWERVAAAARQGAMSLTEHKQLVAVVEGAFAALRTEHQEVLCDLSDSQDEVARLRAEQAALRRQHPWRTRFDSRRERRRLAVMIRAVQVAIMRQEERRSDAQG